MELATFIGISIKDFWEITPFELNIAAISYKKQSENKSKESIYQAFLISRWVWQKKIDINKILKADKKEEVMTDEQMLAKVKQLNVMFGGETVE